MRRAVWLLLVLVTAGCADAPVPSGDDVIVLSGDTAPVQEAGAAKEAAPAKEGIGHIAGFVLDTGIRPLENATVTLVALDRVDRTDRRGAFEFTDLPAGSYIVHFEAENHEPAESVVDVTAGEFVRVRALLTPILPAEPFVDVHKWSAHVAATDPPIVLFVFHRIPLSDQPYPDSVQDAVLEGFATQAPVGTHSFDVVLGRSISENDWHATGGNPFWAQPDVDALTTTPPTLHFAIHTTPAPAVGVDVEWLLSLFHHHDSPPGYSAMS